jgi:hypothetical protein
MERLTVDKGGVRQGTLGSLEWVFS